MFNMFKKNTKTIPEQWEEIKATQDTRKMNDFLESVNIGYIIFRSLFRDGSEKAFSKAEKIYDFENYKVPFNVHKATKKPDWYIETIRKIKRTRIENWKLFKNPYFPIILYFLIHTNKNKHTEASFVFNLPYTVYPERSLECEIKLKELTDGYIGEQGNIYSYPQTQIEDYAEVLLQSYAEDEVFEMLGKLTDEEVESLGIMYKAMSLGKCPIVPAYGLYIPIMREKGLSTQIKELFTFSFQLVKAYGSTTIKRPYKEFTSVNEITENLDTFIELVIAEKTDEEILNNLCLPKEKYKKITRLESLLEEQNELRIKYGIVSLHKHFSLDREDDWAKKIKQVKAEADRYYQNKKHWIDPKRKKEKINLVPKSVNLSANELKGSHEYFPAMQRHL